ncbi:integrase [Microvirga flocculans]|uniref:Integrase n=1 Tax=Microvirga flocculans TaxID=217168 RepID=A0A7W6N6I1_9HYPH|nr:site-specific integrase [Microvirga flocculans]MBB4038612.1 integrase [Microvirga flocculans]
MATFRKRGSSWQVQVRREGHPPLSKSFPTKSEAMAWARGIETQIDRAELPPTIGDLRKLSVEDLLCRYEREVTPTKRGEKSEKSRIGTIRKHDIAKVRLCDLSGADVAKYRNERLKIVKAPTVRRELVILRHLFEVARLEWNVPLTANPVGSVKIPKDSKPRERRLEAGEAERLLSAIGERTAWYLRPLLLLAIETGMRRGELLSVQWKDVNLTARTIRLHKTKNGEPRVVPLTPQAIDIISSLKEPSSDLRNRTTDYLFPVKANAVRLAWERLRTRAGIEDLRLHDLRHEAVSRFFELGLTTPEVALISGHRDPRMLNRYTHLKPKHVAEKLARLTSEAST